MARDSVQYFSVTGQHVEVVFCPMCEDTHENTTICQMNDFSHAMDGGLN